MGGGASRQKAYETSPSKVSATAPAATTTAGDTATSEAEELVELRNEVAWLRERLANLSGDRPSGAESVSKSSAYQTRFSCQPVRKDKVRLSSFATHAALDEDAEDAEICDVVGPLALGGGRARLSFAGDRESLKSGRKSCDVFREQLVIASNTAKRMPEAYTLFAWLGWSPPPESPCSRTLHRCFPTAVPGSVVVHRSSSTLRQYGFTPSNTIYGQSICPDEINNETGDLAGMLQEHWGECFTMGGIGGCPFVGKTGFKAFSHHVPDNGNVLVMFGPHIAISELGELGQYLREGQSCHSTACGAVLGAYAACKQGASLEYDEDDMQQSWIKTQVAACLAEVESSSEPVSTLMYRIYDDIEKKILKITNTDFGDGHLALIGGIQINMPKPFEDHFQPMCFTILSKGNPAVDKLARFTEDFPRTAVSSEDVLKTCCLDIFSWLELTPARGSKCFQTLEDCYAGALPGTAVVCRTTQVLTDYGMTPENSIFGHSICPDEINNEKGDLGHAMGTYWGECFPMGGLGGAPFVGRTGFNAFSHHVPDEGHVIILFGPHIAISDAGELGQYLRQGQHKHSAACGAVLAAYDACKGGDASVGEFDFTDMQQSWLKDYISKNMKNLEESENPLLALSYTAYGCVKEKLLAVVNNNFGNGRLVLLGGIQINLPSPHEDHFMPLMFELWEDANTKVDLLPSLT